MLPRLHSFYGKMVIIAFGMLCLVLHIERVQVGERKSGRKTVQRQPIHHPHAHQGTYSSEDDNVNRELNRQMDFLYEESVRRDLQKQEPGIGDDGKAIYLHKDAYKRGKEVYKKIAVNEEASERISYNRTLVDSRNPACLELKYDVDELPTASVIIIFFNEPYSVVLRTLHSTLRTCPATILKEIILVDDGSTNMELGGKLDYYIRSRLRAGKVQVLRHNNNLGIVRSRLDAARIATGEVLIFLDAHCEANIGWCEPLVQHIKDSRSSVAMPIVDLIDPRNFEYVLIDHCSLEPARVTKMPCKTVQIGGFDWSGHFVWVDSLERTNYEQLGKCGDEHEICPAQSPIMMGGLFAIDRIYFWEMGSYDEQMDGWGGENLEMSFRIWQCGGTIEVIPCSRVGHIFHQFYPHNDGRDTHGINTARLALVWMDDYVNIFFLYRPELKSHPHIGNVTDRIKLRQKLRCKSFDWYLKNVYPEKFVPTKDVIGYGRIKAENNDLCLDYLFRDKWEAFNIGLRDCRMRLERQIFYYTKNRMLRNEWRCATVDLKTHAPYFVSMVPCLESDGYDDKWTYVKQQFMHEPSGLCLDHKGLRSMDDVRVDVCDPDSETQRWVITHD